jgi:hypothetical protein
MNKLSSPLAPISWGELVDKITILEIKRLKILSSKSLINVNKELVLLNNIFLGSEIYLNGIFELKDQLFEVNVKLWEIEDKIRIMESKNIFDDSNNILAQILSFNQNDVVATPTSNARTKPSMDMQSLLQMMDQMQALKSQH